MELRNGDAPMEMTEIRKESLNLIEYVHDEIEGLAQRAADVLGYSVLQSVFGRVVNVEPTPLQIALKALDMDILRPSDVLAYMKERQIEQTRENFKEWHKEFIGKDQIHNFDSFRGCAWVRTKIAEYKQPVPEFVLVKAVQIKQAMPECEIWVESLETHPDPFLSVGLPDGSYSWSAPKEIYYVEVWAEPKFEGRMSQDVDELAF
jgi:hypothetical protein